ncbi:MAG: ankyrin repeat domain-containing protein [Proteobacteria bacterium]|nr:ankyrin repeat domain-containing protein [Pseudomonadota bacterium]MDG4544517.1 ankyrin repeat domain-containing protein [Rickettsiales bacterium]
MNNKKSNILLVLYDGFTADSIEHYENVAKQCSEKGVNVKILGDGIKKVSDEDILEKMDDLKRENPNSETHVFLSQHGDKGLRKEKGVYEEHNASASVNKILEKNPASITMSSCFAGTLFENEKISKKANQNAPPVTVLGSRKHETLVKESDLELGCCILDIADGKSVSEMRINNVMRSTETAYYGNLQSNEYEPPTKKIRTENGESEVHEIKKNTGPKIREGHYEEDKGVITNDEKLKSDIKRRIDLAAKNSGESLDSELVASKKSEVDSYSAEQVMEYRQQVLATACTRGNIERVKACLESDAIDINKMGNDGNAPIHNAATANRNEVIDLLIDNGANIDIQTKTGNTALHLAAREGHIEAVDSLLKNDADTNIRNEHGMTAKETANNQRFLSDHLQNFETIVNKIESHSINEDSFEPIALNMESSVAFDDIGILMPAHEEFKGLFNDDLSISTNMEMNYTQEHSSSNALFQQQKSDSLSLDDSGFFNLDMSDPLLQEMQSSGNNVQNKTNIEKNDLTKDFSQKDMDTLKEVKSSINKSGIEKAGTDAKNMLDTNSPTKSKANDSKAR